MAVIVKHRFRGDGRIWLDGTKTKVLKDAGGWRLVESPNPGENARVLFRAAQDLVLIERRDGIVRVSFHKGEGSFDWDGRSYRIAAMDQGEIRIEQEGRAVARGRSTLSGARLDSVATELLPIIRPLTWALALRTEELAALNRYTAAAGAG